jgi:hypothetical protein
MNVFSSTSLAKAGKLAAVSAVALGSIAVTGAAGAETAGFKDARGDIAHGADLHNVRVVNEAAVRVKVRHDDLVRSFESGSGIKVFIDTKRGQAGPEYIFLGGTFEGSDYALVKADGWKPASRRAEPLACGYIMKLNYADDIANIRIDHECIGDPDEVRVAVRTGGETDSGFVHDWLGDRRELTAWVARG